MSDASKYSEIIARRKVERENEDDKPLRFKVVKTVDGGTTLIRA
jgi:hypothetical protein